MEVGKYLENSPGNSRCKTNAQTDVRNEIFAIVFGKGIMGTE